MTVNPVPRNTGGAMSFRGGRAPTLVSITLEAGLNYTHCDRSFVINILTILSKCRNTVAGETQFESLLPGIVISHGT
jgi:hypothetical protein